MRFYPKNNLYQLYKKYSIFMWLSPRIKDHTQRWSLDLMNRAMNCCERWGSFLDVGAGSGRCCVPLLHKFKKGFAIEVDPNEDLKAVKKAYSNLTVYTKLVQDVKIKEKIDFILAIDVIEHIPSKDIPAFLKSIADMQDRGGIVHIATPNAINCGPAEQSGIYYKRHTFGHYKQYTKIELEELFSHYGYKQVFYSYEDSPLRLVVKMIIVIFSYIDKKILQFPLVSVITAPFAWVTNRTLQIIGWIVYVNERNNRFDDLYTRTLNITFKKLGVR
jgi:SAM-dependent methyltransferase